MNFHFLWLLPQLLLLLVISLTPVTCYDPEATYKQQVIVVFDENSPVIQRAGRFLYQKHDTSSYVVVWNRALGKFEVAEWNADLEEYEVPDPDQQLPIGTDKAFKWSETLIQVLGSENVSEHSTISGFSEPNLAGLIALNITDGNSGQIDITFGYNPASTEHLNSSAYLTQFMTSLQYFHPATLNSVTLKSDFTARDHSGRELRGQPLLGTNMTNVEWRHASPAATWLGYFNESSIHIEETTVVPEGSSALKSRFFGILPEGAEVHVTDCEERSFLPPSYSMADDKAFEWVDAIAEKTYSDTPLLRAHSFVRQVQFLAGHQEVGEIPVIEIGSISDLLKELRYYGDNGPANDYVYYRFGDWVVGVDVTTFSVTTVGIVPYSSDPVQVQVILDQWQPLPNSFPEIQSHTGSSFFTDVTHWINGENKAIGLEMEDAYTALCGVAMFLSAPARCFHTHVTNMMSLDLAHHNYLTRDYFFSTHPMNQEGAWQILDPATGKKKTGLDMLQDEDARAGMLLDQSTQKIFNETICRISRISKSWLSHVDSGGVVGSRELPPATVQEEFMGEGSQGRLVSIGEDISSMAPMSRDYLREYELGESVHHYLSTYMSEPELGAVDSHVEDFLLINDKTLSLQASIALASDHAYVSGLLHRELQQKQLQTGKVYEIVPDSIEVEDHSDIVSFFVREVGSVSSELEQITTVLDTSHLRSKALIELLLNQTNETRPSLKWLKKGEGLASAVLGIASSIQKIESGKFLDVIRGSIDLGKDVYMIGDITGINKIAEKYLGKVLNKLISKVAEAMVKKEVELFMKKDFISYIEEFDIMKKGVQWLKGKIVSVADSAVNWVIDNKVKPLVVSEVNSLVKGVNVIVSILYGIYDIYEDFKQHTVIGYINGAFDIASTILPFFGPEVAPFEAVLSIIKMGVDYFYVDISKELHALPPDASLGQMVVAVLKGVFDSIVDIISDFIHNFNIFAIIGDCHKLDQQYDNDRNFLEKVSDYRNYYSVMNGNEINFAGGSESWNGGDIVFRLGENDQSNLTMLVLDSYGNQIYRTQHIDTHGVEDIVLGIGESHSVSFRTVTVHAFFFIPVDRKRVISGISAEKQTLHGTYYGNSHNNKFIAVQELPPRTESEIGYNLHDYHYTIYGGGGNDSFYLGPQPTYVEGNEGSDIYFINSTSTFTEINSHSGDGQEDTMIINLNFSQLVAKRSGLNLNITSSNTHRIVILNWFHDATHQRVIFKTADGVLFRISATITERIELIPYALSGSGATRPGVYDARLPKFAEVVTIAASEYDDVLYGNDLDNQLNGGGGGDTLIGGEGQDVYNVDLGKGVDTINNFAVGEEVDTLVIGTTLDQLMFSSEEGSNDLYISHVGEQSNNTGAVITNWFLNETYRHMLVVTQDQEVIKVSAVKNATVSYQPLIVNMSDIEEQFDNSSYTRKLDLNSSPEYSVVTTVFGTPGNDFIVGNGKENYITGGEGSDYIEGREGADTYVLKPGDGDKIIMNCAKDSNTDTLLFAARFDDIVLLNRSEYDLVLKGSPDDGIKVTLENWFSGTYCQHMIVRSADGVTFGLPNTTTHLTKTAIAIDNSNLTSSVQLILSGKWQSIERVTGSQGDDVIIGNSLDNYLDPGVGNCYLRGGNGSDTYIIRSTYGEDNVINNFAEDNAPDTILFLVSYLTIQADIDGTDIVLSSLSRDGLVVLRLAQYNVEELARHMIITTSDGISFVLPLTDSILPSTNISDNSDYKPIPVSINLAQTIVGQHINLTASLEFPKVLIVYGSARYQNTIIGNQYNNTLVGGVREDFIQGLDGDDVLKGAGGDDVIEGGAGSDTLVGGNGDDSLDGGKDNDVIWPGVGSNHVDGGSGVDTVLYSGDVPKKSGIELDLSQGTCRHNGNDQDILIGIENAYGTEFDDILRGDNQDNMLVGQGGNDHLSPGTGYDILYGGDGNDTYDLTEANGTVTIQNYATDRGYDVIVMSAMNASHLWYEIAGDDVILRVIHTQYPVFYDGNKPAVIVKGFMTDSQYQHAGIETDDGSIVDLGDFTKQKPAVPAPTASPTNNPGPGPGRIAGIVVALLCVLVVIVVTVGVVYRVRWSKRKHYVHIF